MMKKFRWLFIILGIVLVLGLLSLAAGSFWLNSFIHSDAFRHQVEARASQASGGTVEIKQIDFSIFSGVKLEGLATKLVSPHGTVVSQVESVNCAYSPLALLERRVQIDGVTIHKPQIVLTQLPPASITTPPPPATAVKSEPTPTEAQSGKTAPFQVILEAAKINDGTLLVQDKSGATKANLQGVEVNTKTGGYFRGEDVTGKVTVATIALPENLNVTNFSASFTYRDGAFAATPFEATAFGGHISGTYKLNTSGPSLLDLNATELDMLQIGQAANPTSPIKLSGSMNLQSAWKDTETGKPTGEGDIQITSGKLIGSVLLNEIADAFHLQEMKDPDIKSLTTHFRINNGTTYFSNFQFISTAFEMTGNGTIDPQGGLSADMIMTLNADAFHKIPAIATTAFSKTATNGGSIAFHLSGTVSNPQSDAMTRLFIQGSKLHKDIKRTFDKLFQ